MVLQGKKKSSNFIKKTERNFGCLHCYKAQEEKKIKFETSHLT